MADPKSDELPPTREPTPATIPNLGHARTLTAAETATIGPGVPTPLIAVDPELDEPGASDGFEQRYEQGELLGEGGMGAVRRLRDRWVGREVAVKTLRETLRADPGARSRFLREVRVQGQLEHPGVIPVYDVARADDGAAFFTMRRVRGPTLADALDALADGEPDAQKRYSRRKLLTAFVSVCMTVHYAHTRGVVHRDLKPDNIMLGDFGEVYVLDWGIARVTGSAGLGAVPESPRATGEGPVRDGADATDRARVIGTPGYMAPEQALARGEEVGTRSDVYALGVILFEMLTLQPYLKDRTLPGAVHHALNGKPERPSARAPQRDIAPELDAIVLHAMAHDPAQRFDDVRALADAVERYLDGDRDLERRRALAVEQLESVRGDLARAMGDADGDGDARVRAVRGVLRALALDPEQNEAQQAFGKLLLEPPKSFPREAEQEIAKQRGKERAQMALLGSRAWGTWLGSLPIMMWMGVKSPLLVYGGSLVTLVNVLLSYKLWRRGGVPPLFYTALLISGALVAGIQSSWLSPLILMPTSIAFTTTMFAMYGNRRERITAVTVGALTVLTAFALEWLGWVPRSFAFEGGRLVLFPRALDLPPALTTFALLYCLLTYTVFPALYFGRLRDSLAGPERQLHLQAWQLRQLFPGSAPGRSGKGSATVT